MERLWNQNRCQQIYQLSKKDLTHQEILKEMQITEEVFLNWFVHRDIFRNACLQGIKEKLDRRYKLAIYKVNRTYGYKSVKQ